MARRLRAYLLIMLLGMHTAPLKLQPMKPAEFIDYRFDPQTSELRFFWKDDAGRQIGTFTGVKKMLERENRTLVFAMNGGMFHPDRSPVGLYVENSKMLAPLNKNTGSGNFFMQPNGVFFVTTDGTAGIVQTADFKMSPAIRHATQSGPMLLTKGMIHSAFRLDSKHANIRNGVCLDAQGRAIFSMSKNTVTFHAFASHFKNMGCTDALYLDGFVSRVYWPDKKLLQTDGNFGVMIAVVRKQP